MRSAHKTWELQILSNPSICMLYLAYIYIYIYIYIYSCVKLTVWNCMCCTPKTQPIQLDYCWPVQTWRKTHLSPTHVTLTSNPNRLSFGLHEP